jgi:hypothetical protein
MIKRRKARALKINAVMLEKSPILNGNKRVF